jgi:hypothetical protein
MTSISLPEIYFFRSSRGHVFVVGVSMPDGELRPGLISWSDNKHGSQPSDWMMSNHNEAGSVLLPIDLPIDADFKEENGVITVGNRVRLTYVGQPFIWQLEYLSHGARMIQDMHVDAVKRGLVR